MDKLSFYSKKNTVIDSKLENIILKLKVPKQNDSLAESVCVLYIEDDILKLQLNMPDNTLNHHIDFLSEKSVRMVKTLSQNQIFKKALGLKKSYTNIIDLTAGWGQDLFLMHELGLKVTAIEKNPVMYLLLWDALNRWLGLENVTFNNENFLVSEFGTGARTLSLIHADSVEVLDNLNVNDYPELIYLDPMFPEKKKKALSNKKMQILKFLLKEEDNNLEVILYLALKRCKKRLVLKRPLYDNIILNRFNNYSPIKFEGKSIRYDVFVI